MKNYIVAPTEEGHLVGIHRAVDIVAREEKYLAFTKAPPVEQSLAFYRDLLRYGWPQFVALNDNEVVGWIDISPQLGQARAHIGALGIGLVPSARHQGLGARLMQAAIDKAWANGLTRIELSVWAGNDNARALYERFGFELEGTLRKACRINGVYRDVYAMALLR
ncbi:GNAT family N-acetyltransferase [Propionivibrio soli]|uniref:GNAT family N-acetyltransferase n=1 Tax=Propionivibrio soli TaxID=2976531 RepID=UPI0021E90286|nr:GNAT family N-acetyltransferase [Propionivibrio soli]